jgi:hypothetical protein
MSSPDSVLRWAAVVACLVLVTAAVPGGAGASVSTDATNATDVPPGTVVVNDERTYRSIQSAVDDAPPGATVEVGPGVYAERVRVDETLTLVGSADTRLVPPPRDDTDDQGRLTTGIVVANGSEAAPTVRRLRVEGFDRGLVADGTGGDWVVENVTFAGVRTGVLATDTEGAWTVRDARFVDGGDAVYVAGANETWRVADSTFENNSRGLTVVGADTAWTVENATFVANEVHGVGVSGDGAWTVADSTFRRNGFSGLSVNGDGDWRVRNSTFTGHRTGIRATYTGGDWTVRAAAFDANDRAVDARRTTGRWRVHRSAFDAAPAVVATGAARAGNATRNWWAGSGAPADDDCVGNVTCGDPVDRSEAGRTGGG